MKKDSASTDLRLLRPVLLLRWRVNVKLKMKFLSCRLRDLNVCCCKLMVNDINLEGWIMKSAKKLKSSHKVHSCIYKV